MCMAFLIFFPLMLVFGYLEITLTRFNKAHKAELEAICAKHGAKLGRNLNFLEKVADELDKDASK